MTNEEKQQIFNKLEALFRKHKDGLELRERVFGSPASNDRPSVALYGKEPKSRNGAKPTKTHVASATLYHKGVTLHINPVGSDPNLLTGVDAELLASKSGESWFTLTSLSSEMLNDIERMLAKGIELYKSKGWI